LGQFYFAEPIDPHNPRDPNDPPPEGWDTNFDAKDFSKARFGSPPQHMRECQEWEEREMKRLGNKIDYINPRHSAFGWVYTKAWVKVEEGEPVTM